MRKFEEPVIEVVSLATEIIAIDEINLPGGTQGGGSTGGVLD